MESLMSVDYVSVSQGLNDRTHGSSLKSKELSGPRSASSFIRAFSASTVRAA